MPASSFLKFKKGVSIIEILIVILLLGLVTVGIFSAIYVGFQGIRGANLRIHARTISTEKLEELKNMPYDSLATQTGTIIPAGNIPDNQEVVRSNAKFNVNIVISYVDDPYDGNFDGTIPNKPIDLYPYDYKRIEVKITEPGKNTVLSKLTSDVSAKAAETSTNTGILSLKVIDAVGAAVSLATVEVKNTNVAPPINILTSTDTAGKVLIPKLPPDANYEVKASLTGYSSEQTYPATIPNPNPVIPNVTILVQQVSNLTLSIDRVSIMEITAIDSISQTTLSGISLTTTSDKLIYTNPNVPKFTNTQATNPEGKITLSNVEWDSYSIAAQVGYFVSSTSPPQNFSVAPNATLPVTIRLTTSASAPTIKSHSPKNATSGSTVDVTIIGTNLFSTTSATLIKSGQPNIVATGVVASPDNTQLTATFNLIGAATGAWDLEIRNLNNEFATQPQDFTVQ